MSYETCRADLVVALETLVPATLQRVYADPPANVEDVPCAILYGSSGYETWAFGGMVAPDQVHTEQVRLVVHDESTAVAPSLVRALRVAVLAALRTHGGLGGDGVIERVGWSQPGTFPLGGRSFVGQDLQLTFAVVAP